VAIFVENCGDEVLSLAVSLVQHLQTAWQSIRVKIIELNLFKTPTMRTDPFERTILRISTWIYLVLLCVSMIIIVLFTWLSVRIESGTVKNPSLTDFEELQKKYPRSLQCPCSQIAIPHSSFISISPQFHPVCTSWIISDEWIYAMANAGLRVYNSTYKNILLTGPKFFISLNTFCEHLRTIVSDASFIFNQSSLISDQVLSSDEFMARANQTFNQFKSNTVAESKRSLALIRSQTVTMYTMRKSDACWRLSPWRNSSYSNYFQPVATQIGNCSCALDDECKEQVVVYNETWYLNPDPISVTLNITNMFSGCFVLQSLLQSSLECFFDQTCVDHVVRKINLLVDFDSMISTNLSSLQRNSTRFSPNALVGEMINEMMIETWGENIDYSQYYKQCMPKLCTYSFTSHNDALYVFTTMIGLFGGLSVALSIIVPFIVTWIRKKIHQRVETDNVTGKSSRNKESYLCRNFHI
jgi:hypothetical protein